jgi:hypothetical protein
LNGVTTGTNILPYFSLENINTSCQTIQIKYCLLSDNKPYKKT